MNQNKANNHTDEMEKTIYKRDRIDCEEVNDVHKKIPILSLLLRNPVTRNMLLKWCKSVKSAFVWFSILNRELFQLIKMELVENHTSLILSPSQFYDKTHLMYPWRKLNILVRDNSFKISEVERLFVHLEVLEITCDMSITEKKISFALDKLQLLQKLIIHNHTIAINYESLPFYLKTLIIDHTNSNGYTSVQLPNNFTYFLPKSIDTLVTNIHSRGFSNFGVHKFKNLILMGRHSYKNDMTYMFSQCLQKLHLEDVSLDNRTFSQNHALTHLSFGNYFNRSIEALQHNTTITHLYFGRKFNQKLNNLPPHLIHLGLLSDFNQRVDKLPDTLECLEIDSVFFDQELTSLPKSLKYLVLHSQFFAQDNLSQLPSLVYLELKTPLCRAIMNNLPVTLETLIVSEFGVDFDYYYDFAKLKSLKKLTIMSSFNDDIGKSLPRGLTHLNLSDEFNKNLYLPQTLKYLRIGKRFASLIDNKHIENLHVIVHPDADFIKKQMSIFTGQKFNFKSDYTIHETRIHLYVTSGNDYLKNIVSYCQTN